MPKQRAPKRENKLNKRQKDAPRDFKQNHDVKKKKQKVGNDKKVEAANATNTNILARALNQPKQLSVNKGSARERVLVTKRNLDCAELQIQSTHTS